MKLSPLDGSLTPSQAFVQDTTWLPARRSGRKRNICSFKKCCSPCSAQNALSGFWLQRKVEENQNKEPLTECHFHSSTCSLWNAATQAVTINYYALQIICVFIYKWLLFKFSVIVMLEKKSFCFFGKNICIYTQIRIDAHTQTYIHIYMYNVQIIKLCY